MDTQALFPRAKLNLTEMIHNIRPHGCPSAVGHRTALGTSTLHCLIGTGHSLFVGTMLHRLKANRDVSFLPFSSSAWVKGLERVNFPESLEKLIFGSDFNQSSWVLSELVSGTAEAHQACRTTKCSRVKKMYSSKRGRSHVISCSCRSSRKIALEGCKGQDVPRA